MRAVTNSPLNHRQTYVISPARPTSLDTREQLDNDLPKRATKTIRDLPPFEAAERAKVVRALLSARLPRLKSQGRELRDCSSQVMLQGMAGGVARIVPNRCDSRFCGFCNGHRHRKSFERFEAITAQAASMGDGRQRFLTLTQEVYQDEELDDCLARLERRWTKLRRSKAWSDHVVGCVASFELTWSHKHQGWHCHLHLVFSGWYWPQSEIAMHWGGIVDIRDAGDPRELFKYTVKTAELKEDQVVEAATSLFRRKLVRFYGSYLKVKPPPAGDDQAEPTAAELHAVTYIARREQLVEPGELVCYNWKRLTWVAQQDPEAPDYVRAYAWKTIRELLEDLKNRSERSERRRARSRKARAV